MTLDRRCQLSWTKHADILVTVVEALRVTLVVGAGNPQQKIGQVGASFGSLEHKGAVEYGIGIGVDLVEMEFAAHPNRMVADDARIVVHALKRVVDLG